MRRRTRLDARAVVIARDCRRGGVRAGRTAIYFLIGIILTSHLPRRN